ncbi:MAG: sensor histidine kinase [Mycobacterium leprae]
MSTPTEVRPPRRFSARRITALWRESLPARAAMATAAILAVVLLVIVAASYVITAYSIRDGVDSAMRAALPATVANEHELEEHAQRLAQDPLDSRRLQLLDLSGRVYYGPGTVPVSLQAVAAALQTGRSFVSMVPEDGVLQVRSGPTWWQTLTPVSGEVRVMYTPMRVAGQPVVLQIWAPIGPVTEALPTLLLRMLALAALAAGLTAIIVWQMASTVYRPLREVTTTAGEINMHTLDLRVPDRWHDTTLHRLTQVLNSTFGRLQEAFQAQGRFVAAAAHELRGPLGAMRAELEVTLRRERSAPEYREALEGALEETGRLSKVAELLLILARYEHGGGLMMEHALPLAPLLERAATEARRSAGGDVLVVCDPDLSVDGDTVALERMVSNLARNGIQAGGSPVQITAEAAADSIRIDVTDQGSGIAPDVIPHLFEPFYRGDPARGRDGGTGLGLAIVKAIVDGHHGTVTVYSELGKGSTFTLRLPAKQA